MSTIKRAETPLTPMGPCGKYYIAHGENVMIVAVEFADCPTDEPIPLHSHPHEQITYVVEGEMIFYLDGEPHRMQAGDMIVTPPNVPHTIRMVSPRLRVVDTFTPLRDDLIAQARQFARPTEDE